MKKLGFTLAEVLITLGIIGVVSAVTLPTLMSNSQYKQLGVKLSKFHSTLENSATAYVNANGEFMSGNRHNDFLEFMNESFLFRETYNNGTKTTDNQYTTADSAASCRTETTGNHVGSTGNYAVLKDGTLITGQVSTADTAANRTKFPIDKYGSTAMKFCFGPNVKGLPSSSRKFYTFYVSSKGYVLPPNETIDPCMKRIYDEDFNVKSAWYKGDGVCATSTAS